MKTRDTIEENGPEGLPVHYIEACLEDLRAARYAPQSLNTKRRILTAFANWMTQQNIGLAGLDESVMAEFMKRSTPLAATHIPQERAALRQLLAILRREGLVRVPEPNHASAIDQIYDHYVRYLREERGLAQNSVLVYAPFIRDFLRSQDAGDGQVEPSAFDAVTVRSYLLAHSQGRSGEYMRLMAVALRSFLGFLFLRGEVPRNLAYAVPMVRTWRQSSVPRFLTPEQEAVVLASPDRSTPRGRRDYAVLLLLARLGLRAHEVVSLELDDIRWRSGELVVHGKGQRVERMPLLADVGEALAAYLHEDRGASASRRVFLRLWAPRVGLTGPAAVAHIVRLAFAQAGFRPTCRGAAHLFRHGLATTMIRHGASMAEIAEVLRHRSQDSTAIYAKVSFETLRGVARDWPTMGGGL